MEEYKIPLELFDCGADVICEDEAFAEKTSATIEETLAEHGIKARVAFVAVGPTVTTFAVTVDWKTSPHRVLALKMSLAIALQCRDVRCCFDSQNEYVFIEVLNQKRSAVTLGSLLQSEEVQSAPKNGLTIPMGKNTRNDTVVADLSKLVHMLVSGCTGSGKSAFLHSMIVSLICKHSPKDLRLMLLDPKCVEFPVYKGLPHVITGEAFTDSNDCIEALGWAIAEMERRFELLEKMSAKGVFAFNVDEYNQHVENPEDRLPKIVIVVDELADLMLVDKNEVERKLQTLAQKARAAGIHVIVATQRPSSDVLTGILRVNFPTKVAFQVAAEIDSRIGLDYTGAQELSGKGDYLYTQMGMIRPVRMQAPYVSYAQMQKVVEYVQERYSAANDESVLEWIRQAIERKAKEKLKKKATKKAVNNTADEWLFAEGGKAGETAGDVEPVYYEALKLVVQTGTASISMIQRRLGIGFSKAGKIIEWMEENSFISPYEGPKARTIYMTVEQFEARFGK